VNRFSPRADKRYSAAQQRSEDGSFPFSDWLACDALQKSIPIYRFLSSVRLSRSEAAADFEGSFFPALPPSSAPL
jgi:hypothetical protein